MNTTRPRSNEEIDQRLDAATQLLDTARKSQLGEVKVQLCRAVVTILHNIEGAPYSKPLQRFDCSVCEDKPEACSKTYSGGWVGTPCPK